VKSLFAKRLRLSLEHRGAFLDTVIFQSVIFGFSGRLACRLPCRSGRFWGRGFRDVSARAGKSGEAGDTPDSVWIPAAFSRGMAANSQVLGLAGAGLNFP